jgi:hypothetical protein
LVFAKKDVVDDNCVDLVCNQEGLDAVDEAETLGLVSNISFGVGLAAVAAGVLMVVLAPDDEDEAAGSVTLVASPTGAMLKARW